MKPNISSKDKRLAAISEIIKTETISSQEELSDILKTKGFNVTQATLSRDIKELNIIKINTGDFYKYTTNAPKVNTSLTRGHNVITSIDKSENLVIIKTGPGFAAAVASEIDNNVECQEIMGTIAGDDTILMILRSPDGYGAAIKAISARFKNIDNVIK